MVKVLIAGGDEDACSLLRFVLQQDAGISVVGHAKTGGELLGLIVDQSPQVVLVDVDAPGQAVDDTILEVSKLQGLRPVFLGMVANGSGGAGSEGMAALLRKSDPFEKWLAALRNASLDAGQETNGTSPPGGEVESRIPVPPTASLPRATRMSPVGTSGPTSALAAIPPRPSAASAPSSPQVTAAETQSADTGSAMAKESSEHLPADSLAAVGSETPGRIESGSISNGRLAAVAEGAVALHPDHPAAAPGPLAESSAVSAAPTGMSLLHSPDRATALMASAASAVSEPAADGVAGSPQAPAVIGSVPLGDVAPRAPAAGTASLTVAPFGSFRSLAAFQEALAGLDGVRFVKVRRFHRGTLYAIVQHDEAVPLEKRLQLLIEFKPQIISSKPGSIELRINPGEERVLEGSTRE